MSASWKGCTYQSRFMNESREYIGCTSPLRCGSLVKVYVKCAEIRTAPTLWAQTEDFSAASVLSEQGGGKARKNPCIIIPEKYLLRLKWKTRFLKRVFLCRNTDDDVTSIFLGLKNFSK